MRLRWWLPVICSVMLAQGAHAEVSAPTDSLTGNRRLYHIPRVNGTVTVDAVLDEPIWKDAVVVEANYEVFPADNVPAPVKTEALLAYDDTNLYVAFRCDDPEPDNIRAHLCDRDNMYNDDNVMILFDTFNDERRSYNFYCNPMGIQGDKLVKTKGWEEWDGIWYSAGKITDTGYIVEMAIPFATFSFQRVEGEQTWSFDVVRNWPRNIQHLIGAFPRDRNNNSYLSQAHKLTGFAGVVPGKNVEINPTFSTGYSQERHGLGGGVYGPIHKKDSSADPGVTATWGMTSNMVLSATINPDFSQVEADAAQMDINIRFPLYYSEKRPFFMEGSDFYKVGNFVHTRTLADPDWGVKLTGKAGRNTIGFFTVRDTVTPLMFPGPESARNTTLSLQSQGSMIRYRRDILNSSTVGVLITDREGTDYHNRVAVADGEIRFTKKDTFSFQAAGSATRYPGDVAADFDEKADGFTGTGYEARYDHTTDHFNVVGIYREFGPDFRTDLGFITRVGERYTEFYGQYRLRGDGDHWYTYLGLSPSRTEQLDWQYRPIHRVYSAEFIYQGPLDSWFVMGGEYGHDWYEGNKYRANVLNVTGGLRPNGSTNASLTVSMGDGIDFTNTRQGSRFSISPNLTQKVGDRLTLGLIHNYETLTIDPGLLYTANVTNTQFKYQFTRRAFLRLILQFVNYDRVVEHYNEELRDNVDPLSRRVFSQALFSYEINPRTVFYLGYSDNYLNRNADQDPRLRDNSLIQTNRAVFAKIGNALQL